MGPRVEFLIRRLNEEGAALLAQLAGFTAPTWARPVYPAEQPWTVHSILAHLVSAEGYLQLMISDILQGGPGAPPGVDIDATNAAEVAALTRFTPAELIEKLAAVRAKTVEMVAAFSEADLDRRGNHPVLGDISLDDFVKLIYRHDKMHMRDVQHAQKT
jgi:hypothetical protein